MLHSAAANRRASQRDQVDCLIHVVSLDKPLNPGAETGTDIASQRAPANDIHAQDCIVHDVSASGLRIWADRPYGAGEHIEIRFACEKVGLEEENVCTAMVAWADPQPVEGRWQIGLHFDASEASRIMARALAHGCPWCEKLCPGIV